MECPHTKSDQLEPRKGARFVVAREHVQWADIIFVMEPHHLQKRQQRFGDELARKKVYCLNIPDIYDFLERHLITELKSKLREYVEVPE
jgi:predicted protein tyrosine phosphatase